VNCLAVVGLSSDSSLLALQWDENHRKAMDDDDAFYSKRVLARSSSSNLDT